MSLPVFAVISLLIVGTSLGVIVQRNPVRSALCLVATLFLLAVMYVFLDAHLVAVLQIIVYAGAIMVLFLFVIMLLNLQVETPNTRRFGVRLAAGVMAGLFVALLARLARQMPTEMTTDQVTKGFGTTEALAETLFTKLLLPFEITSVLLLVAIVGAVVLAKRKLV